MKIALVVSHPIQHFCPQYVSFAKNKNLIFKVFFASALGKEKYFDENFRKEISWGNLHLDKFDHVFLNGNAIVPSDKNIDAPSLDAELAGFQPDIVITYGYFQKLQKRAYQWAIAHNVKLAYISDSELRQSRNKLKVFIKQFYLKKYFYKIDYFLTVGDANEEFYKKHGVEDAKIKRMHFPIDIELYKRSWNERNKMRTAIREQFHLYETDIVMSVVGKLVPWKNQDHIIDAMLHLENKGLVTHLFIIGSGEMMEEWEKKGALLKKSKVFFCGFVNIENLPAYYAATDIYVHPASAEPHSIAVSEAIYMGCPVIISDRCGSYGDNDDVQVGKNGYVYEFGNITGLSENIKTLGMDKSLRNSFSAYSHKVALQFQQRAHYEALEDLLTI